MRGLYFLTISLLSVFILSCSDDNVTDTTSYEWVESSPEQELMNADMIIQGADYADNIGTIDGILIARNNHIVYERYYNGYGLNTPHDVRSVSKSFLSAIAGIAIHEGLISLDDKMLDFFPENVNDNLDPRKYNITVQHLLTMNMGINSESLNNYSLYMDIYNTPDWIETTINLPLVNDPGSRMRYNTFGTHLLAAIIQKAADRPLREYAQEKLCTPIGITIDNWESNNGYYFGGNAMQFTLRELATFGLLYLKHGRLNDTQVVPGNWVDLTTVPFTNWVDNDWGDLHDTNYGYLWWMGKVAERSCFLALGYGGQFIIIFPAEELIIATYSPHDVAPDYANNNELQVLNIVANYFLPALN